MCLQFFIETEGEGRLSKWKVQGKKTRPTAESIVGFEFGEG